MPIPGTRKDEGDGDDEGVNAEVEAVWELRRELDLAHPKVLKDLNPGSPPEWVLWQDQNWEMWWRAGRRGGDLVRGEGGEE